MVLWELYWRVLGSSWGSWGGSWDPLGALLGLSWGPLGSPGGPLGAILEVIDQKRGGRPVRPPPWGPQNRLLGRSWSPLGALLGALGAVLGASWAPLGAFLGHLGVILRPPKRIGSETARRQQSSIFFGFLKDFGLLEGSWKVSKSTWNRLVALLGLLGGMMEVVLSDLALS